jgi:hypothetical protein
MTSCWQNCNKSVELNNLVASCQPAVDNLSTSWEQAVRTHPVDKLLEQHCYKSAAGLLQLVRFYVCNRQTTHVKISHLVASLPTNRQQVVFALLVPSCQQVWNNLSTVATTLLILSDLLQGCSNKSDTVMI